MTAWTKGLMSGDARNSSTSDSENVRSIDCFVSWVRVQIRLL